MDAGKVTVEPAARTDAIPAGEISLLVMQSMADYPPGLIGTVAALFGRTIAASHGVDWTLDAMIAEEQCEFFRRFDPSRDRVWAAVQGGCPLGALTLDGPRPECGRHAARIRFFVLDESLRGRGVGRSMLATAMQFCKDRGFRRVFLTTLPGLDAARRLYEACGFTQTSASPETFHGSHSVEIVLEASWD